MRHETSSGMCSTSPSMGCIQRCPKRPRISALLKSENEPDYFEKLPNDILIKILDRLPMEEAMRTTFLSKRWKNLWKWKLNVEIGHEWVQKSGSNILHSLFKIFGALGKQDLRSISLSLCYDESMLTKIQSLISYVSKKKVRELCIDFSGGIDDCVMRRQYPLVPIPECELNPCLALVKLRLKSLELWALPPSRFRALKELYLESVRLLAYSVKIITGNCPLSLLCLCNCNQNTQLNIFVAEESNLCHLIIREEVLRVRKYTTLTIRAPNVRVIEFGPALPRKRYVIEGSLDCSEAAFRLTQMHCSRQAKRVTKKGMSRNFTKKLFGLLMKLRLTKLLTLSSWCIQVLSIELVNLRSPLNFGITHLILETGLTQWEFQGIAYMLSQCNKLNKLVVVLGPTAHLHGFNSKECAWYSKFMERWWGKGLTENVGNNLQDLEIVEFRNLSDYSETSEREVFNEIHFFGGMNFGPMLLSNLKMYPKILKKVIFTGRSRFEIQRFTRLEHPSSWIVVS